MNAIVPRFSKSHHDTSQQAAKLRPEAAKIWLSQLEKLQKEAVAQLFEPIPVERISDRAFNLAAFVLR